MQRDRPWWALAALGAAPLLHPNGLYFLCAAATWRFVRGRRHDLPAPLRPTALEHAAMAIVLLAWLGYAAHVAMNWGGFASDMEAQLQRKVSRDLVASITGRHGLRLLAFPLVFAAGTLLARARLAWTFALAAWLLARVGHEMWYEPFDALVLVVLLAGAVEGLAALPTHAATEHRAPLLGLSLLSGLLLLFSMHKDLPAGPSQLSWKHMSPAAAPYVLVGAQDEVQVVAEALRRSSPGPMECFPRGDALLFVAQPELNFVDPARFDFGELPTVVHLSPAHPRHWQRRAQRRLKAARDQGQRPQLLHARDNERQWWLVGRSRP